MEPLPAGCEPDEVIEITRRGDDISVRGEGAPKILAREKALFDKCLDCRYPKPVISDILLKGDYAAPVPALSSREDELRGRTAAERWAFWSVQFGRCIRCYACRNVCPACFCPRCLVEENEPQWVSPLPTYGDNLIFHLMRMMHVAGTCTSCGECQRVCPVGIPLMKLNEKMAADLQELFQFVAGVDMDAPLPFRTFSQEDQNDFIR